MTLNNVVFAKHQRRLEQGHYQFSIYDFLPEGESQEFPPSETEAQVDEAQESKTLPSSALDTSKKPTEDTDNVVTNSTLFSVGDHVTIIGGYTEDDEDYEYLKPYVGKTCWVVSVKEHHSRKQVVTVRLGDSIFEVPFYWDELTK